VVTPIPLLLTDLAKALEWGLLGPLVQPGAGQRPRPQQPALAPARRG